MMAKLAEIVRRRARRARGDITPALLVFLAESLEGRPVQREGPSGAAVMAKLARQHARRFLVANDESPDDRDDAELILVLARMLEGKPAPDAFGAPGDWGYGTEIGAALADAYRSQLESEAARA